MSDKKGKLPADFYDQPGRYQWCWLIDNWTTFNEDGVVNGLREDAPDDVRKAYNWLKKEDEENLKNGIIID